MTRQGAMIVIDGLDGSGKSGAVAHLASWLEEQTGETPVVTREPGGSIAGEAIRSIFKDPNIPLDGHGQLLMIMAARRQHILETIQPALDAGKVVLCDRYLPSTIAYQGNDLTSISPQEIIDLDRRFCPINGSVFNIIFIIGLSTSLARLKKRGITPDRFDGMAKRHFTAISQTYMRMQEYVENCFHIDANQNVEEVLEASRSLIKARLREIGLFKSSMANRQKG